MIEVTDGELLPRVDPRVVARDRARAGGIASEAVVLLTGCSVATFERCVLRDDELFVTALATVGLGNALRAGDPPAAAEPVGTINLLVHCRLR